MKMCIRDSIIGISLDYRSVFLDLGDISVCIVDILVLCTGYIHRHLVYNHRGAVCAFAGLVIFSLNFTQDSVLGWI